ncbi:MAG: thiamine pyrophosphate-dependent enzyme [Bacillota bacterium]|nr:thiamine pyrophosphate-dependent enzyme [Bacillota bacterium]
MTTLDIAKNPFDSHHQSTWCPGCGNFPLLDTMKKVFHKRDLRPQDVLMVSGIGQAAKLPHYINAHGMNGLHGRALPSAMGAIVANSRLTCIVNSGDGDTYGEGGNHFMHNIRRNLDLVHIVHNNQIYGLTKGQASPTTAFGQKTVLQKDGVRNMPLNPIALAVALDCSFVARSFTGNPAHLAEMIERALDHRGYALIDVMQPCVSFNKVNTFRWYADRVRVIGEEHDPSDRNAAFQLALQFGDEGIPIGVIYENPRPTFLENMPHITEPLVDIPRHPSDIDKLLGEFM